MGVRITDPVDAHRRDGQVEPTDEQLVDQCQASGCLESLEELLRRHLRVVRSLVFPMVLNHSNADDLTQEVFLRANRDNSISVQGYFLTDDENVYVSTSGGWARLNTKEWKFDLLAPRPLPKEFRFSHHGVSTKYGLISWNRNGPLHRVSIAEPR